MRKLRIRQVRDLEDALIEFDVDMRITYRELLWVLRQWQSVRFNSLNPEDRFKGGGDWPDMIGRWMFSMITQRRVRRGG